jgi:hypothetical protein
MTLYCSEMQARQLATHKRNLFTSTIYQYDDGLGSGAKDVNNFAVFQHIHPFLIEANLDS